MDKNLLTKNGIAVIRIARSLLEKQEGERIEPVALFANQFGMGRGTIQAAIKYLQECGVISLSTKRRTGTFIEHIDYKKLWELADMKMITGVMPLPYSRRYEGIATGLYKSFEKIGIPLNLAYMRGGYRRVEALLDGKYDFAIMSLLAFEALKVAYENLEIVLDLGEYSYVGGHRVLFSQRAYGGIENGMRVALDATSVDQFLLTIAECIGKDVRYVELSYNQILENLDSGNVDAAVWNVDEVIDRHLNTHFCDFRRKEAKRLEEKATVATIVTLSSRKDIINIFRYLVEKTAIAEIQKKILSSELLPQY